MGETLFNKLNTFNHYIPVQRSDFSRQRLIGQQAAPTCADAPVETAERFVSALGQRARHRAKYPARTVALAGLASAPLAALVRARRQPQPRREVLGRWPACQISAHFTSQLQNRVVHQSRQHARIMSTIKRDDQLMHSPLLANVYLHELDVEMREAGLVMVRYADDAVVLCRSREEAEAALVRMQAWVSANGLTLHPDKTHVGDCRVEGQGFEFLGYRFEAGQRWVRKKSLMSLRDKIRTKTKRSVGDSMECVIASLNPILKGWFGYFKHAHRLTFSSIDGFVRRRLRAVLRRQKHRPGQGRCLRDHKQWPNAFFADHGLFTMREAHQSACQSR